jgi:hypothetical protein
LALSGLSLLVILLVFGGAAIALLSQVDTGHTTFMPPWVRPGKWIPEIVLGAIILLYALSAPALASRLRMAADFQRVRAFGMMLMVCSFLLPGLRLAASSLPVAGTTILLAGVSVSAAAQARMVSQTRSRLKQARGQGRLKKHLDEERWTWEGRDSYRVLLDTARQAPPDAWGWARRLHWLGPAAGIMAARYLTTEGTLLFGGGAILVVAIIAAGSFCGELGLALQLAEWERERGQPLTLAAA